MGVNSPLSSPLQSHIIINHSSTPFIIPPISRPTSLNAQSNDITLGLTLAESNARESGNPSNYRSTLSVLSTIASPHSTNCPTTNYTPIHCHIISTLKTCEDNYNDYNSRTAPSLSHTLLLLQTSTYHVQFLRQEQTETHYSGGPHE